MRRNDKEHQSKSVLLQFSVSAELLVAFNALVKFEHVETTIK